jgi:hypothetical protein
MFSGSGVWITSARFEARFFPRGWPRGDLRKRPAAPQDELRSAARGRAGPYRTRKPVPELAEIAGHSDRLSIGAAAGPKRGPKTDGSTDLTG